jgi:hypothetical protein
VETRLEVRNVQLRWRSPQVVIVKIDGRELALVGSEHLEGDIQYSISSELTQRWRDGEPLDPSEKDSILRDVVAAARERGWTFAIES